MNFNLDVMNFAKHIGKEQPDWAQRGEILDVYLVPIDKLYYNDDNGRIATFISSYNDLANEKKLNELTHEEYNKLLHDFIKKSNQPEAFKKTKSDIELKGQIRPGVVLSDGRVVSGNRRFTVLRELYSEKANDKFFYFKCFIINKNPEIQEDRKYIKTIERLTQFGVDEKVDYDPIARLVDIYNDLLSTNKLWSIEEYSKKLNLKKADIEKMVIKAQIMIDYLEYINHPNKFYIARQRKLDGPLQDLIAIYKKIEKQEWNRIRPLFYSIINENGDRTRLVRDLVKSYFSTPVNFEKALKNCITDIEKSEIELINKNIKNQKSELDLDVAQVEKVIIPNVLSEETKTQIFQITNIAKLKESRDKKIDKLFSSMDTILLSIQDTYQLLNEVEIERFNKYIEQIEKIIMTYKGE